MGKSSRDITNGYTWISSKAESRPGLMPGPAAYFPTASHKQKLVMEKDARLAARARVDAEKAAAADVHMRN